MEPPLHSVDLLCHADSTLSTTQNRRFIDLFAQSIKAISPIERGKGRRENACPRVTS